MSSKFAVVEICIQGSSDEECTIDLVDEIEVMDDELSSFMIDWKELHEHKLFRHWHKDACPTTLT